jgi:succinyl-CoA synthetase beta subunit
MNSYREFLESDRSYKDIEYDKEASTEAMNNFSASENGEKILEAYGIETALTDTAESPEEAVRKASKIGYPVALKIDSPDISHKSDVNGVKTDLRNREDVQQAFREMMEDSYTVENTVEGVKIQEQIEGLEVALGMKRDPQFGPMIMVGLGGIYVEALQDISFGIAPVSEEEAEEMIEELQASELFKGVRGEEHSLEPVKDAIIRLGELALNHEEVSEIDLNPLVLKKDEAYVVDIEFVLDDKE